MKNKNLQVFVKNQLIKVQQIIKVDNEIKKLNKYINGSNIGFLATGDESNFRLFLKNNEEIIQNENKENSMKEEENKEDNGQSSLKENNNDNKIESTKEIFKIEQVLSDHDNEVTEAIQIKSNTDIISGSKDSTVMIWKDFTKSNSIRKRFKASFFP